MKNLNDIDLKGKVVFIRADLNVPLNSKQEITDDNRIKMFLPTLEYVLEQNAKVVLSSHLGRPNGEKKAEFSLKPVADKLNSLINNKLEFVPETVGDLVQSKIKSLNPGSAILIENVRFHKEEEENSSEFAKKLAQGVDVYINDAFATAHRAHASTYAICDFVNEKAAGFLMQKELDYFNKALVSPQKPLCVILGGAKVSSKFPTLLNIADKADKIIIGGAMANTFIAAQGMQIGRSLCEPDLYSKVIELMAILSRNECKLYLPVDFKVSESFDSKAQPKIVTAQDIPADTMALDIGPASNLLFNAAINDVSTIVWNGPMGAFENDLYSDGTSKMATSIGSTTAMKVAGGGDTVAAINSMELAHKFDYISTGGGAFLELMEGKILPGVKALG